MERQRDGKYIKKGPWTREEDEILLNYVNKYGARDWSSIRSMKLLPRTGKSCRLRWVNKLRPNLKTGCKFSAEEERVVIELQAQFGNKWAKIATFLPGRTDNDVKNFWSTRRKRLERILQASKPKSQKNKGKNPVVCELPTVEVPPFSSFSLEQETSYYKDRLHPPSYLGNSVNFKMVPLKMVPLPELVNPNLLKLETTLPIIEATPIHMIPSYESSSHCPFSQLSQPQLDVSLLPECQELVSEPNDPNFLVMFEHQEGLESGSGQNFLTRLPPLGLEDDFQIGKNGRNENNATPDSFFDEFPTDMFDHLESLLSTSEW